MFSGSCHMGLKPMRNAAWLIRNYFKGIVASPQIHRTNGILEALNGLFLVTKRQTRGRISFERMRTVLFRIAVKLDFARINPHAAEPTRPPRCEGATAHWCERAPLSCATRRAGAPTQYR